MASFPVFRQNPEFLKKELKNLFGLHFEIYENEMEGVTINKYAKTEV